MQWRDFQLSLGAELSISARATLKKLQFSSPTNAQARMQNVLVGWSGKGGGGAAGRSATNNGSV